MLTVRTNLALCIMFHIDFNRVIVRESRRYETAPPMTKKLLAFVAVVTLTVSLPAWAGSILDMPIDPGGHVTYGKTGRTDLWGAGIGVGGLNDAGKSLDLSWGRLFFETGTGEGWKGNTLNFAPGGEFAVRGCVDGSAHSGACGRKGDVLGVLMSGTFLKAKLIKEGGKTIFIAQFLEKLNPALAALMKLPIDSEGEFEMVLGPGGGTPSCIVDNIYGGSMSILSEPSEIAILAASLIGLLFALRVGKRRRQNTSAVL